MEQPVLALVAFGCALAAIIWGRSARYRHRVWRRLEADSGDGDLKALARADVRKDAHTSMLYGVLTVAAGVGAVTAGMPAAMLVLSLVLAPVGLTLVFGRNFVSEARLVQHRSQLERRAQEVLVQEDLAPKRWAARLAPDELPDIAGFEIGRAYQAGSGVMAGDFYDVFSVGSTRFAVVIGDVSGQGIEPAITAFQAKYLLRVFLRQYRDPAQAVEELNRQMSAIGRDDEFISLCVAVFDTQAGTLRYTSAGHPTGCLWHDREVHPIRATGPLVMLDPRAEFASRELAVDVDDVLLVYTDGLTEARVGDAFFGEERVAQVLRRDPGAPADVLCKSLVEAATDFTSGPINDDVAILAIRRT